MSAYYPKQTKPGPRRARMEIGWQSRPRERIDMGLVTFLGLLAVSGLVVGIVVALEFLQKHLGTHQPKLL